MAYNLSFMDNQTSVLNIIDGVNTASGSMIGIFILLIVWIGILALAKDYDFIKRWIVANFLTTVIGILLYFIGWVSWIYLTPIIGMLIISILINYYT